MVYYQAIPAHQDVATLTRKQALPSRLRRPCGDNGITRFLDPQRRNRTYSVAGGGVLYVDMCIQR